MTSRASCIRPRAASSSATRAPCRATASTSATDRSAPVSTIWSRGPRGGERSGSGWISVTVPRIVRYPHSVFDFLNGPVRDLVTQIYEAVGYLGVALWVAIESVIIPIPSELVLPFAGFLAADSTSLEWITGARWNIPLLVLFATIGSLVGALVAYAIGYWGQAKPRSPEARLRR